MASFNNQYTNRIKPIETIYNGYRFRSRLEARWAVFFTMAGIKFEYEHEGFDLGEAGYYLPDFWLPDVMQRGTHRGVFIEIKPTEDAFTDSCDKKAQALVIGTGHPLILCCGLPERDDYDFGVKCSNLEDGCYEYTRWEDEQGAIAGTDNNMSFQGSSGSFFVEFRNRKYSHGCDDSLFLAADAAKQARFEHGERGFSCR